MIVHRPAAVRNQIFKPAFVPHIILRQDIRALISSALPLSRKKSHPIQLPVGSVRFPAVFDKIPDAKRHFYKLIPDFLRIADGILRPAKLHPPEVLSRPSAPEKKDPDGTENRFPYNAPPNPEREM